MSKLQALVKQVETCRLCPLCRSRQQAVPGEGNENATVLLIGEGPGYHEDREGRPFIGPAGQFLEELLGLAGLRRSDVYITNVVKCRPPNNRDPLPVEIDACAPYLDRQIAAINPKVIITLGRFSMAKFVNETSISRIHGQVWPQEGRVVVTMYHPAAGLHNDRLMEVIREDFRKLPGIIEQVQNAPATPAPAPPPPDDPLALLDAYAALVAAPEPPPPVGTAEVVIAAPPPPAPIPVNPEAPVVAVEAADEPLAVEPLVIAEAPAPFEAAAPAPRPRRSRKATTPPPPVAAAAAGAAPPALSRNGHLDTGDAEAVSAAAPPSEAAVEMETEEVALAPEPVAAPEPEPPPAAPEPAAPARKKGKPAPAAEQLSLF